MVENPRERIIAWIRTDRPDIGEGRQRRPIQHLLRAIARIVWPPGFFRRAFFHRGRGSGRMEGGAARGRPAQATIRRVVRWGASPWRRSRPNRVSRTCRPSGTWSSRPRSGTPEQVSLAMSRLMCRYAGAVHRYLLGPEGPGRRRGTGPGVRGPLPPRRLPTRRPQSRPVPRLREARRPEPDEGLLPSPTPRRRRLDRAGRRRAVGTRRGPGPVRAPVPPELAERPARSGLELAG